MSASGSLPLVDPQMTSSMQRLQRLALASIGIVAMIALIAAFTFDAPTASVAHTFEAVQLAHASQGPTGDHVHPLTSIAPSDSGDLEIRALLLAILLAALGVLTVAVIRFVRADSLQTSAVSAARTEAARAAERLKFALNSSPLALAVVDSRDRIDLANTAWQRHFPVEKSVGSCRLSAVMPSVASQLLPLVDRVRTSGQIETGELQDTRTSDSVVDRRIWSATVYPIVEDGATSTSIGLAMLDVTEQRRLEDELRESQRMEALGRLAGGIAHDFNNVLTAITGFTDLAAKAAVADGRETDHHNQVRRAADRAALMTRQLLAFSRKETITPSVISINEVLDDSAVMLQRLLGTRITLTSIKSDGLWPVLADPGQIEQVIVNLAINARDAMPDGGTLAIETTNLSQFPAHGVHSADTMPDDACVLLRVADTGKGIPDSIREHIFEPFFTTKSSGRGTGLGLATVQRIVQQAGGTIDVQSGNGCGTMFSIFLPRANPLGAAATSPRV